MKFSIIVPFYNTNIDYFNRMINSLLEQTYKKFEVIIVDDGSEPNFAEILDVYNYKNMDVKIIHQKNKGLPGARNTGIKNATGQYMFFVDSDDVLPKKTLQEASGYIEKYGEPDIIFGKMVYYAYRNNEVFRITKENCLKEDMDGYLMSLLQNNSDILYYSMEDIWKVKIKILHQDSRSIILGSSSANAYKSSIIHSCMFNENVKICEDQIFNRNILKNISTCLIVPDEWYFYIQYRSSMLHNQSKDIDLKKTFSYWDEIEKIDKTETPVIKHSSNVHNIGLLCDEIKKMAISGKRYEECKGKIDKLYEHSIMQSAMLDKHIWKSSINKVKLFLFRKRYTRILFYLYAKKI